MWTLYENILSLCQAKGVKGGKMCVDLGLSKSLMTDLKAGRKKSINSETAKKIADYFEVSVDRVVGGTAQEKAPTPEDERDLPHAKYREVLAEGGIRLLLDADAKVPQEHLDDIVEFIKFKQQQYGR